MRQYWTRRGGTISPRTSLNTEHDESTSSSVNTPVPVKVNAVPKAPSGCPPAKTLEIVQAKASGKIPPFTPVENVLYDPNAWRVHDLIRTVGVTLIVVPPGACSATLRGFLAGYLAGKFGGPFALATHTGDVLVSTHSAHGDESLRANLTYALPTNNRVLTRTTPTRFNWKTPDITLKGELEGRKPGELAAVIVDAGPLALRVDESIVEAAYRTLSELARNAACQIIVMVEATSRHMDPFERIPRSLRILHGTILVVPLRSKALTPTPGTPPEFLLVRLADAAPTSITARFSLPSFRDAGLSKLAEWSPIQWGQVVYDDPREAFRRADIADLTAGQRVAVRQAAVLIVQRGPMTSTDLQAAGQHYGIAPTTMRDALTIAGLLGHLFKFQNQLNRHWYWALGTTPFCAVPASF